MFERVFLDWQQPCLPLAAEWLIDRYGRGPFDRMLELIVVVPGRRAGRRLLELLVDAADKAGVQPCPPRIVTPARLDEVLLGAGQATPPRLLGELAWIQAAAALPPDEVTAVFGPPPAADDLSRWLAIAAMLDRLHGEVAADALSFADVADRCQLEGLRSEVGRWRVLCKVRERYLARLDDLGYADPLEARLQAIASTDRCIDPREIVLVGIADLPRSLRKLLVKAASQLTALVQAPADRSDDFDELGCVRTEAWADVEIPLVDEQLAFCGGPNDQAAAAVARLSSLAEGHAIDDVVIGVPDREVLPRLRRLLDERGVPSHDAAGEPVHRSGPGMLLAALADFLDTSRYPALATLLRHPDVEAWLSARQDVKQQDNDSQPDATDGAAAPPATSLLTVLDEYFANHLPFGESRDWPAAGNSAVGRLNRAVSELLGDLVGPKRPLAEWGDAISKFLDRVYGRQSLDVSRRSDRVLAECFETIQRSLETLGSLDAGLVPKTTAAEAIRTLSTELARAVVAPPADEHALELLGWLELPLDDTSAAIVTGMNEGVVPPTGSADAFLPDGFRRRLGMSHDRERLARDAYLLSAILASRREVFVTSGKRTLEGNPRTPSRLLLAAGDDTLARRVERYCNDETSGSEADTSVGLVPGQRESTFVRPPVVPPTPPITALAVTAFRDYLACPYRFYLRHVLGLRALDDSDRELSAASFGSLAHEVLAEFAKDENVKNSTDSSRIDEFLSATLDDLIHTEFGREILPAVRLQTEQLRLRFKQFAIWQAGHRQTGWQIEHCEKKVEGEKAALDVDGTPFYLRGRIDRVDVNELTGEKLIVDYKTSEATPDPIRAHQKRGEWVDLQLPLYRHLAASFAVEGRVKLAYIGLPKKTSDVRLFPAEWTEADLSEADEVARDVVRGIRAGRFELTGGPPPPFSEEFAVLCLEHLQATVGSGGDNAPSPAEVSS